ncbi:MAG: polyhydroxyalkanoate depolymerase [Alphaproteobacteria bacterium]|nr:polyhydroxyalkanoate depolymerase [Alphaproteobacteria bacterium]
MLKTENSHLYNLHEMQYAVIAPLNMLASASSAFSRSPFNPLSYTGFGRHIAAAAEVVERVTARYGKPEFGIDHTIMNHKHVTVYENIIEEKPFCRLLHFEKYGKPKQPKLLLVAPMSGHHATLLRGTVEALLPHLDVYITDWLDAREVSMAHGAFHLEDYISYTIDFIRKLGPDVNLMAVCQPSVPVMIAASVMNEAKDPMAPRSMTLIGGPIDTRINPTKVNQLAETKPMEWFEKNVITRVPFNYPGFMRSVYPGFLQLSGFMQLNLDRHIDAHKDLYKHLVQGDGESAAAHRKFYDEYLSVADLPAEFYLESIHAVFQEHLLPRGEFVYKGKKVKPETITKTALLTLEGELDDISGVGQTEAAQRLCKNLPANMRKHHIEPKVGHYGIFNGRKFRENVVPIIVDFVTKQGKIGK